MNLQKYWRSNSANKLTIALFFIYLIALFWILLFKLGVQFSYMGNRSVNLVPFNAAKIDLAEIFLNVVIFIPLGIYAGALLQRQTFGSKLLFLFLVSLLFESLQYIFRIGAFDITDIITNTLGGIIGLLIFKAIGKLFNNSVKSQKFVNLAGAIGTVLMVSLLLLLKMNMLPVRYQ